MKKQFIAILFILINFIISADPIINIWADNSSSRFGVSKDRVWLKSYFLSNFEYYTTINTETKAGVLTAVTVSRELYFLLDDLLKFDDSYSKGAVTISKKSNIYNFLDTSIDLNISFSLEKPKDEILNVIKEVYKNDPKTEFIVKNHYLESWVIRVHSAENVISPDLNSIEFDDVLISATIIGEKEQWLWGIHDGVDYIYEKLKP